MLRAFYDWTLSLAARKSAEIWLAVIAFIESSVFLVPADVLFLPMALARPGRAYRYAAVATVASVLGGIAGYFLGYFAYEAFAKPILSFYGKLESFETLKACTSEDTLIMLLVTSGLAHLPPIKVVTILSGVVGVNLWLFILLAIVARGARFFALAWLLHRGPDIVPIPGTKRRSFLEANVAAADLALDATDLAEIDAAGRLRLVGRIKDNFKSSKGKYVAPAPIEHKLIQNLSLDACLVIGAGLSQPIGVVVLNEAAAARLPAARAEMESEFAAHLRKVNAALDPHEKLDCIVISTRPWTPENGLLTPTLKAKRASIEKYFAARIADWGSRRSPVVWEDQDVGGGSGAG